MCAETLRINIQYYQVNAYIVSFFDRREKKENESGTFKMEDFLPYFFNIIAI